MFESFYKLFIWIRGVVPNQYKNKWIAFLLVLFSLALDNFIGAGSLVIQDSVQLSFKTTYATASWVLSAYTLTLASFIIIAGKFADILGPMNLFFAGQMVIFVCSLITFFVTNSVTIVIIFRAIQGIGAAMLVPSSFSITANYFKNDKKGLSLAMIGLFIALAGSLGTGPLIAGALVMSKLGYRAFFLFVFAADFILFILSLFLLLPIDKNDQNEKSLKEINYFGMVLFVAGLLLIILGLTEGGNNWKSPTSYVSLPVGILLIIFVLIFELHFMENYRKQHTKPSDMNNKFKIKNEKIHDWMLKVDLLFPREVMESPNFLFMTLISAFYYMAFSYFIPYMIMYRIYIIDQSALLAGVHIIPYIVVNITWGLLFNENWYRKIGFQNLIIISTLVSLAGDYLTSRLDFRVENSYWKSEFVGMMLIGLGAGTFFNIYFNVFFPRIPVKLQGIATGIFQSLAQVGFTTGIAIETSILGKIQSHDTFSMKLEYHERFKIVKYISYGIFALIFILACSLKDMNEKFDESEDFETESCVLSVNELKC
ncbi:hypothetical protein DAMA08_000090 [Martiniozyma asiatica (nom. inval.)]|nr:hypothetical protein DAMA08_000090 [Martiniozyma asiatica]